MNSDNTELQTSAKNLLLVIDKLITEQQYDGVLSLFTKTSEAQYNIRLIPEIYADLFKHVCLANLTHEAFINKFGLFKCAAEFLWFLAINAPVNDVLPDVLEMVEGEYDDNVFTVSMKALQAILLRIGIAKSHAVDWSVRSIYWRIDLLSFPNTLLEGYDNEKAALLESNAEIQTLLKYYIAVTHFYQPLIDVYLKDQLLDTLSFQYRSETRLNILCCFLFKLLGRPLGLLDISANVAQSNKCTMEVCKHLTLSIIKCIGDPLYFLYIAEQRLRWASQKNDNNIQECEENTEEDEDSDDKISMNIFMNPSKLNLSYVGIYYHQLLFEGFGIDKIPLVYTKLYICESGLYLATKLLQEEAPPYQKRGQQLAKYCLNIIYPNLLLKPSLENRVHRNFCLALCHIIGYSSQSDLRQNGVLLLRQYIESCECDGQYIIITNLLRTLSHSGLLGYLIMFYKELASKSLENSSDIPDCFKGTKYRQIFLNYICHLQNGSESDLIDIYDCVISTLNVLRFFAIKDRKNRTGFWDILPIIENNYLQQLRKGLDISVTRYKNELQSLENGDNTERDAKEHEALKLLKINVKNSSEKDEPNLHLNSEQKIKCMNQHLCTFELIRSLLARTTECIEQFKPDDIHNASNITSFSSNTFLLPNTIYQQHQLQKTSVRLNHNISTISNTKRCLGTSEVKSFSTDTSTTGSTTIDEFRLREEKREEDFQRQQAEEENEKKKNEEQKAKEAKLKLIRTKVLEAALVHVPKLGWTRNALIQGAEDAGFPSVVHGIFPEGGYALVSYFYGKCNDNLIKELQVETEFGTKQVDDPLDFLVRAVRSRLEMIIPYKAQWPQAIALIAMPQNALNGLAQVLTLVDDICYYSGDRSVDITWYTRRVGLATIMKMTELYMLQDKSVNHENTWVFLRNRMEEATQLQTMLSSTEDITHSFQRSFNSAFITARNILGIGYNRP